MTSVAALKDRVCRRVDDVAPELIALSRTIHANPELAFRERRAVAAITGLAARHGLRLRTGAAGMPTAFAGELGAAGPRVAMLCEYDALPGIGHGCGHHLIAAAGLGAALAAADVTGTAGGRVRLVGCPAEESGGGKIRLLDGGVFRGVAAVLMVHPNSYETAHPRIVAATSLDVVVIGRAAHASLFPERGVNALDGLVLGYQAVAALRPHLPAGDRVTGIIREGGTAANIVPDRATSTFLLRSPRAETLLPLERRIRQALTAAAASVGAGVTIRRSMPVYAELDTSNPLAGAYVGNVTRLGRRPLRASKVPANVVGSSDIGNVGAVVPAIHPMLRISSAYTVPHTAEFAAAAVGPVAERAMLDGAKALAMTAVDVWTRPELRAAMSVEHGVMRRRRHRESTRRSSRVHQVA